MAHQDVRLSPDYANPMNLEFVQSTLIWALIVILAHVMFKNIALVLFAKRFSALSLSKQGELSCYMLSTCHHLVVVPYLLTSLVSDFSQYSDSAFRFQETHFDTVYSNSGILSFSLGFFVGDTFGYYLPRLLKGKDMVYVFHHGLAIYTLLYYRSLSGSLLLALHVMLLTEISTVFFNVAWMCRCLMGPADVSPWLVSTLEYLFALTFFIFRILHLPAFVFVQWNALVAESPIFVSCVAMGLALQFFWFYKITKSIIYGRDKRRSD